MLCSYDLIGEKFLDAPTNRKISVVNNFDNSHYNVIIESAKGSFNKIMHRNVAAFLYHSHMQEMRGL